MAQTPPSNAVLTTWLYVWSILLSRTAAVSEPGPSYPKTTTPKRLPLNPNRVRCSALVSLFFMSKIPSVPAAGWHENFIHNLDQAIAFHRLNTNDPHNVGNAALLALTETRDAFGFAVRGIKTPTPSVANV